MRKWSHL